jgi:hypothetical protein
MFSSNHQPSSSSCGGGGGVVCGVGVLVGEGDSGFEGLGVGDAASVGALVGCAMKVEYYLP